jgi:hypothetical protein
VIKALLTPLLVLKETSSTLSNEQLNAEILRLKRANEEMAGSLEKYEGGQVQMISEEDIDKARKDVARQHVEWRKRKRGCMEIIDTICEGADLNRKEFIKKLGIELDEDAKVNINDYA